MKYQMRMLISVFVKTIGQELVFFKSETFLIISFFIVNLNV